MTAAVSPKGKPSILQLNADTIPEELRSIAAWVGWRLAFHDGRWTKEPINVTTGGLAKTCNPDTWCDFETALRNYKSRGCDGIGLCRTADFVFIDGDGVFDQDDNLLPYPWAEKILSAIRGRAYIEKSVSGYGLHGIGRGMLPPGRREFHEPGRDHTGFAFYDRNRFFTFTGAALPASGAICDLTAELAGLHAELFPSPVNGSRNGASSRVYMPSPLSDTELIEKAKRANDGGKFDRLWRGETSDHPSQSEADAALCCKLAFWTGRDAARMDFLFRQSGLMREKWERDDYREPTIVKACEVTMEVWTPPTSQGAWPVMAPDPEPAAEQEPPDYPEEPAAEQKTNGKLARPPAMTVEDILGLQAPDRQMLIENIVPRPGAVMLMGTHKSGKTVLAVQMAIAVASGHALMNNFRIMDKGAAIILEQDDTAGDISMREYLRASPVPVKGLPIFLFTRIKQRFGPDFCSWLESEIVGRQARLVILDSYTALRPHRRAGGDIVKTESEEMAVLDELAKRNNCTIIILHHVSKGSAALDWNDQGAGTYSIGAAVEGIVHISRFRELPGNSRERLIQGRPRHGTEFAAIIRFRRETLDYEIVLEGEAAPLFVEISQVQRAFGNRVFTPKELYQELGMSRTTAFRLTDRLSAASVLTRQGYGSYRLSDEVLNQIGAKK